MPNKLKILQMNSKSQLQIHSDYNKFHHFPHSLSPMDELTEIQQLYNKIPKQVIAKFTTKLTEYQIDAPQIDLPTEMDQAECNKLLKQLLQSSLNEQTLDSLHFEFLVGGKLLRGQLKSHIIRYDISCEETLEIEYFLAFEPLENEKTFDQEDWVSTVQSIPHPLGNLIVAGLFNGQAAFYSSKNKQLLKVSIDEDCVKSIKLLPAEQENTYYMISGGFNEQIRVGSVSIANDSKISFELLSATQIDGSVLGLSVNPLDDGHFCAVTNIGSLMVHKIPQNFLARDEAFNEAKKKKKKRHLNEKAIDFVASENLHKDSINAVNWITQDRIVTGSSDHCMKLIDVQKMKQIGTVLTKDSITTSIDYMNDRLLTSHEDGYIRLWDVRAPQIPVNTYKAHSKLVSSVKFNTRSNIFASGSYDTTVKVWDCRSAFPLQNLGTHHDTLFSVVWKQEKQLVAGGADSKISVHSI